MYLEHFGLTVNPFGISPRLDFLYKSGAFEESMAHLVYGLDNNEAIILITGAIGTGKTMAIQSFLSYLGDRYISAFITNTCVDGKELLKLILDDLGAAAEGQADKSDLLIAFKKLTIDAGRAGKRIIIIVDEAQNLAQGVLEEIRQLTNVGQGAEQPVQVVLVGQPELEATVGRPELAQLEQRIRVRYKLEALSRRELEEYVDHRLTVAGGAAGTFTRAALDRVYTASGGVPRVVNALCDRALLSAFVAGRHKVEAGDLDEVDHPTELGGATPSTMGPEPTAVESAGAPPAPRPVAEPRSAMATRKEAASPPPAAPKPKRGHDRRPRAAAGARGQKPSGSRRGLVVTVALIAVVAILALGATRLRSVFPGRSQDAKPIPESARTATPPADRAGEVSTALATADEPGSPPPAVVPATADTVTVSSAESQQGRQAAGPAADADGVEADPAGGDYFVHVSSFRTNEHAQSVARGFAADGIPALVHSQVVREQLWYRVYLGPLTTRMEADKLTQRLRDEGRITYSKIIHGATGEGL